MGDICPLRAPPAQSALGVLLSGNSSLHSGKSQGYRRPQAGLDLSKVQGRLRAPRLRSVEGEEYSPFASRAARPAAGPGQVPCTQQLSGRAQRAALRREFGSPEVRRAPSVWVVGVREPQHRFGEHRVTGPRTSAARSGSHTRSLSRLGSQFPGLSVGPCLGLPWWPEGSALGVTGPR